MSIFRILSCNAENASDSLPPLDFTEANDIVKTAMARRGLSDALPTDSQAYFDGSNRGGRGGGQGRGGGRGGITSQRNELKINGKSVCHSWNNNKPCNGTPSTDGCRGTSGDERLHKCSWVENGKYCGEKHRKREHKP